jgi:hypothetical protein
LPVVCRFFAFSFCCEDGIFVTDGPLFMRQGKGMLVPQARGMQIFSFRYPPFSFFIEQSSLLSSLLDIRLSVKNEVTLFRKEKRIYVQMIRKVPTFTFFKDFSQFLQHEGVQSSTQALLVMLPYRKVNTRGRNCSTTVLKEKFL